MKTLDEKYFEDLKSVILIQMELTEHPCEIDENDEWLTDILHQIARDAEKETCNKISLWLVQYFDEHPSCIKHDIMEIINAAKLTIPAEVPNE